MNLLFRIAGMIIFILHDSTISQYFLTIRSIPMQLYAFLISSESFVGDHVVCQFASHHRTDGAGKEFSLVSGSIFALIRMTREAVLLLILNTALGMCIQISNPFIIQNSC